MASKKRRVAFDIECDDLNATVVWCLVCQDIDTNRVKKFLRPDQKPRDFLKYAEDVELWIGHNVIQYDIPVLEHLCGFRGIFNPDNVRDTLVLSRLDEFARPGGHSLENWGEKIGCPKADFHDFTALTFEMLDYCVQDVEVTAKVYRLLSEKMKGKEWSRAIPLEHRAQWVCREMHENGFAFNASEAREIQKELQTKLDGIDQAIKKTFPPRSVPTEAKQTKTKKDGSISSVGLTWYDGPLTDVAAGSSYSRLLYEEFNAGSPKQIVERLHEAGWSPVEKTDTHKEWEKLRPRSKEEGEQKKQKLEHFKKYGWKVNETNLATLPDTAPEGARLLVERIFVASRLRTLEEWFQAYQTEDGRIHGQYNGMGAWTGRMSHVKPNTGNIAAEKSLKYSSERLSGMAKEYGRRMRGLWVAPEGRLLVGTDAEGIQLRILGHYLNNKDFIEALVNGEKDKGTDVHSVNKRVLGDVCDSRDSAKTFIYAFLLGAGIDRVGQILRCSRSEAHEAKERFIERTPGLKELKEIQIPKDAAKGFFVGFDGRPVACSSEHLMLAGYLQNGEATIMKLANQRWLEILRKDGIDFKQVNFIHDEWQTEVPGDETLAKYVGKVQSEAITWAGLELGVRCPLAGSTSYGKTWYETH